MSLPTRHKRFNRFLFPSTSTFFEETAMGALLLWLLGVPLPIIILIALLT